jgi:putative oxidoreductase
MLQKWTDNAIAIVRIIVGAFMIYHGIEVFDKEKMDHYETMLNDLKMNNAVFMSFVGKISELLAGVLLLPGLFTRIGAVIMAGTMGFITFFVGQGRFYMEDQHPFLFVLFAFIFFFDGGSIWSIDSYRRKNR